MPAIYSEATTQYADIPARQLIANPNTKSLSFTRKFQFVQLQQASGELSFPYFPNEELFENQLVNEQFSLRFVLVKNSISANSPLHILSQLVNTKFPADCNSTACIILYFGESTMSVLVRRLQDIVFANVYQINSPVEVVYIAQYICCALQVSSEMDQFYFAGQISEQSQIVDTMKIYFRKLTMIQLDF
jgi:Protein of unknown function (DUF3822)